jgi:hypothetical protein
MSNKYFDLTDDIKKLADLRIDTKNVFDCELVDSNGNKYVGFILAKSKKVYTICECNFQKSKTDDKYQPRLVFKKTDKAFKERNVNKGTDYVRIPFGKGKEGYRELWKMISFLYKWKKSIDLDEFEDYFAVTDKNLAEVLPKIANLKNKSTVLENLKKLSSEHLGNIENLVNATIIRKIIDNWDKNKDKDNKNESYWQKLFQCNPWVLSQIFSCPFVFIQEQFFCGGKRGSNKGGVEADFIYQNKLTKNIAFIEIKTPKTRLVNTNLYRGKNDGDNNAIYSISSEVTGAVNELLNQKCTFIQKKDAIEETTKEHINLKGFLIVGNVSDLKSGQKKSFELYRSSLRNLEVITFDELFSRIKSILEIFNDQ